MTSNCVIAGANAVVLFEFVLVTVILICLLDTTCPINSGFYYSVAVCVCVLVRMHMYLQALYKSN